MFGVSRTKIRNALAKLAQDGVVQIRRNHGASVTAPTRAEARQVIEFRRMVEPPLAAALARSGPDLQALYRHVAEEQAARGADDEVLLVRLTGQFHLRLAELHGNLLLVRSLREAEALLCLSILSYGRPNAAACLPDEHAQILDAIAMGIADEAATLMRDHLGHVAAEMDLDEPIEPGLAAALAVPSTRRNAA